jgi:hypothetical protein
MMRQIVIMCLLFGPSSRVLAQSAAPQSTAQEPVYSGKTLSAWLKDLKHTDAAVRQRAVKELGKIGPLAKRAVPALLDSLKDAEDAYFEIATRALWEIDRRSNGPYSKCSNPRIRTALRLLPWPSTKAVTPALKQSLFLFRLSKKKTRPFAPGPLLRWARLDRQARPLFQPSSTR